MVRSTWTLVALVFFIQVLVMPSLAAENFTCGNDAALLRGVHEISLQGSHKGPASSFFDAVGNVTFKAPSGQEKTVEIFWDGENTWKARAYITEIGLWSWSAKSSSDVALNDKSGIFTAIESALSGMIRVHPKNPRALATDNGDWYAPIGDTAYFMLGSPVYQEYVRDNWQHGVNFLRCNAFGLLRSYAAHFTSQDQSGIPKLSSLQADDQKLQWMFNRYPGMYLQYIMYPENASGKWEVFSAAAHTQMMRHMVARFGAFPTITWQIMNDSAYPSSNTGDTAIANEVSAFLVKNDVYQHLRCTGARRLKGAPFADTSWTTLLHFETLDALAADEADSNANYKKFTWCGEDRYETYKPPKYPAYFFRRLMWAWLLSGGSACYGGDWDATVPYTQTNFTGLNSFIYIRDYCAERQIDLGLFQYNDKLASDPKNTGINRPQVCNRATEEYIIYHPNNSGEGGSWNANDRQTAEFTLDLSSSPGLFYVEWLQCSDGKTAIGDALPGGGKRTVTAPWSGQDVVCRLVAMDEKYKSGEVPIPDHLVTSASIPQRVSLSWEKVKSRVDVACYMVYRDDKKIGYTRIPVFIDDNISPGKTYQYTVVARDACGRLSKPSKPVSVITEKIIDTEAPMCPRQVSAKALDDQRITVSWNAATDAVGVIRYDIFRQGKKVGSSTSLTFSESGLRAQTTYIYVVRAYDAAGNESRASDPVEAKTLAPDHQAPTAPERLTAKGESAHQVSLSWTAATDNINVEGYEVYRNGVKVATIEAYTSYTDSGLTADSAFIYTLRAMDGAGNFSVMSAPAQVSTLAEKP